MLNFVAQKQFFLWTERDLHSNNFAEVTKKGSFAADILEATQLLLLSWELMTELLLCDLFDLIIDFSWSVIESRRRHHSMKTVGKNRLRE